jgi:xanthine dehydrogenase YagS FAD-binding subunit
VVPFTFERAKDMNEATSAGAAGATFLAGGTTLVDLMKLDVMRPSHVVDLAALKLASIEVSPAGATLGALATNTAIATHVELQRLFPVLPQAVLAGASAQIRNVATLGGNLLQRTRCAYFRDLATPCNKREPGSGCGALGGWSRMHAVLGTSDRCIATHPSDLCVALAALDARVNLSGVNGKRELRFEQLHLLPGETPEQEFALGPGELITDVFVPASALSVRSAYVKARDRAAFAFALASCAAAVERDGERVKAVRIALGGVATKPWRAREAEEALVGKDATRASFEKAAQLALRDAKPTADNTFKVPLAQRCVVRALTLAAETA